MKYSIMLKHRKILDSVGQFGLGCRYPTTSPYTNLLGNGVF